MNKLAMVKAAIANHKKDKKSKKPAKSAKVNPAVQSEEHIPGQKKPLALEGNKGGKPVKSNKPFWTKPKGTPENPDEKADPSKVVTVKKKKPSFFQKAKTREA